MRGKWAVASNAPVITSQPQSQTVTVGNTATFSVTATGATPLSYQWQKGSSDISGASSSTYTTPATTVSDNNSTFRCLVSNSAGSQFSNAATLTVTQTAIAPTISAHPSNQQVTAGSTATFSVSASGTDLTFQWQKNGANISGATSANYVTPVTTLGDSGSVFRCIVTNSAGSITSNGAILIVTGTVVSPQVHGHFHLTQHRRI